MRTLALIVGLMCTANAFALAVGDTAPDIWGKRMDNGAPMKLSELRGKVVYVDFWATWCAPCRYSLPMLNDLRREFGARGFEVLGVNIDQDEQAARKLVQKLGLEYPVLRDVGESTYEWYSISAMPAAYVVDRKGKVQVIRQGFQRKEFPDTRARIEKLLEESK
jgi:thiol-disulfide isomerase/thioredoxin